MVTIATYYAKQHKWGKALDALSEFNPDEKAIGLTRILTILAEERNPKLIAGAIITDVKSNKISGKYSLKVVIQAPDRSCKQRADWWEVITTRGELKENWRKPLTDFRSDIQQPRIDTHILDVQPDEEMIVRAHFHGDYLSARDPFMNDGSTYQKSGYTDQAMRGSINEGFHMIRISENFAKHLETQEPLPTEDACQEP